MEDFKIYDLLVKQSRNTLSEAESKALLEWYDSLDNQQPEKLLQPVLATTVDHVWHKIIRQVQPRRKKVAPLVQLFRISAAACVVAIAFLVVYYVGSQRKRAATEWTTIANNDGKIKLIALPDQSTVYLKQGAVLSFNKEYNVNDREIKITGEAFFDVQHNAQRPFIVHAGGIDTRVLGTAFNVEAYKEEQKIRVSLLRGSVQVTKNNGTDTSKYMLQPGYVISYDKNKNQFNTDAIKVNDISAWTKGKIVFNDLELPQVLDRLQNEYHTRFQYQRDAFAAMKITGEYDRNSLEQVLNAILFVHRLQFKKQDSVIHIF